LCVTENNSERQAYLSIAGGHSNTCSSIFHLHARLLVSTQHFLPTRAMRSVVDNESNRETEMHLLFNLVNVYKKPPKRTLIYPARPAAAQQAWRAVCCAAVSYLFIYF